MWVYKQVNTLKQGCVVASVHYCPYTLEWGGGGGGGVLLASYPGRRGERAAWYLLYAHAYTIPYIYRKIVRYMYASHVAKLIVYTEYV